MSGVITQNVLGSSGLIKAVEAGGGAWTLISTVTSDGSDATMSFTSGIDATYPIYCFHFINIHPETDNTNLSFQGSTDSGSSYGVNITSTRFYAFHRENDATPEFSYDTSEDLAQSTNFQNVSAASGNDNDQNLSGCLYLFNPSDSTFVKHFQIEANSIHGLDASLHALTGGYFNTTSAIDAIQFKMSANEIQGGKIKLFGLKDS